MSASPQPVLSTKRPLDDPSSPTQADQPDAKRPALDKILREDDAETEKTTEEAPAQANGHEETTIETPALDSAPANGSSPEKTIDTNTEVGDDGPVAEAEELKPIATVDTGSNGHPPLNATPAYDESTWIHIRCIITSPEAATIIGKGGENVSKIRQMSNAKCTVSDYQKGAIERVLTVSGNVDAVAKAFGLIIRTLNNEVLTEPSNTHSKTYPLRLLVPHVLIGSIIGKGGARIKEIQEASGARLNASDSCLPLSSERSLVVMGVADAVHIATYYVGSTLLEQLNERYGGPAASAYASRSGGPTGAVPGGMQVIPYMPQAAGGNFGNRENYGRQQRQHDQRGGPHMQGAPYGNQYGGPPHGGQMGGGGMPMQPQYGGQPQGQYGPGPQGHPHHGPHTGPQQPMGGPHGQQPMHGGPMGAAGGPAPLTQQIFIPNDMVGAIIGKGGQKINEIRQVSGSVIKINEPQDNSNERLVTISGTEESNRMALYMLYSRLESEKHRV